MRLHARIRDIGGGEVGDDGHPLGEFRVVGQLDLIAGREAEAGADVVIGIVAARQDDLGEFAGDPEVDLDPFRGGLFLGDRAVVAVFQSFHGGGPLLQFIDDLTDERHATGVGRRDLLVEYFDLAVEAAAFGDQRGAPFGGIRVHVERLISFIEGGEDGLQAVVILLLDRIELMVVAAGALGGRREESAGRVRHHVITVEGAGDLAVEFGLGEFGVADPVPRTGGNKALGDVAIGRRGVERVAGQLFFDKAGVGLVVVEGADHVIAVGPGVGTELVLVVAVGVAVVDDVEPVAAPAFAIAGRGQQAVGGAADGGGQVLVGFFLESREFFGRRGQAD